MNTRLRFLLLFLSTCQSVFAQSGNSTSSGTNNGNSGVLIPPSSTTTTSGSSTTGSGGRRWRARNRNTRSTSSSSSSNSNSNGNSGSSTLTPPSQSETTWITEESSVSSVVDIVEESTQSAPTTARSNITPYCNDQLVDEFYNAFRGQRPSIPQQVSTTSTQAITRTITGTSPSIGRIRISITKTTAIITSLSDNSNLLENGCYIWLDNTFPCDITLQQEFANAVDSYGISSSLLLEQLPVNFSGTSTFLESEISVYVDRVNGNIVVGHDNGVCWFFIDDIPDPNGSLQTGSGVTFNDIQVDSDGVSSSSSSSSKLIVDCVELVVLCMLLVIIF